jgi:hypothetical protein
MPILSAWFIIITPNPPVHNIFCHLIFKEPQKIILGRYHVKVRRGSKLKEVEKTDGRCHLVKASSSTPQERKYENPSLGKVSKHKVWHWKTMIL